MKEPHNQNHNSSKYILDTNVFNDVVDEVIPLERLKGLTLFVNHIQIDELKLTKNLKRRAILLEMFHIIEPRTVPTRTGVWGVSKWGQAMWSKSGQGEFFSRLLNRIKQLDKENNKKSSESSNQTRDALIAETAIKEGFVLVTNDGTLATAAGEYGCQVIDYRVLP